MVLTQSVSRSGVGIAGFPLTWSTVFRGSTLWHRRSSLTSPQGSSGRTVPGSLGGAKPFHPSDLELPRGRAVAPISSSIRERKAALHRRNRLAALAATAFFLT